MKERRSDELLTLPEELLFHHFDLLPLIQVFKIQLINKKLHEKVEEYCQNELIIKAISCGQNHSLILLERGRVFATGSNKHGQLGLPGLNNHFGPIEIRGMDPIEQISAGFSHSVMLSKTGEIWVMGDNSKGQLALTNEACTNVSLQKIPGLKDVKDLCTIDFSTAYLNKDNRPQHLGNTDWKPTLINNTLILMPNGLAIPHGFDVIDLSISNKHALFLTKDGAVYGQGELGLKTLNYCDTWTKLPLPSVKKIKATSLGSLILTSEQELMAVGNNKELQFGTELGVKDSFETIANKVTAFDANEFHTLYVDDKNQLHGFGRNEVGELGAKSVPAVRKGLFFIHKENAQLKNFAKSAAAAFFPPSKSKDIDFDDSEFSDDLDFSDDSTSFDF